MPRFLAFPIVLGAAVVALNAAAPASTQDLSPGCQLLNDPSWEAGLPHSGGGFLIPQPFAAGELITTYALAALDVGDTASACDSLQAFLNQVRAQNGKKLTSAQAEGLTDTANDIRALLGC